MKSKILIIFTIVFYSFLYSTTYEIKQDGTGDFTNIQAGVDEAVDNDTVLVYPGTYFENIIIQEKSITLGSLTLTTGNQSYKYSTIIDGNQTNSCIQVREEYIWGQEPVFNDSVNIIGFTMQHGKGTKLFEDTPTAACGGGILIFLSITKISDCVVKENTSLGIGGGISVFDSKTYLSDVSIHDNKSRTKGGGVGVAGMNQSDNSRLYFDNENLCNIYNNYGTCCSDFFKGEETPFIDVIVDTFTVANPSIYYIAHMDPFGNIHPELINLSMQHSYFEQIEQDIYVSPDGDDSNSGLSIDDPFQTIAHALTMIKSDSLNHRTIYLSNGVYSQNLNNQWLPIHAKEYVSVIGESVQNTVIDAEELSGFILDEEGNFSYTFRNLDFINGKNIILGNIDFERFAGVSKYVNLENINIENSKTKNEQIYSTRLNIKLNNVNLLNNFDNGGILFWNSRDTSNEKITLTNCRIIKNYQWVNIDPSFYARPIAFVGVISNNPHDFPEYTMINCEINNCHDNCHLWPQSAGGISTAWNSKINIINCTIGDNSSSADRGAAIFGYQENSIMNIYNSIIYGNTPRQIVLENNSTESYPYILNIKNSLIQEGNGQVYDFFGNNEINWLGGNLREDPLWNISTDNQYFLSEDSPCIDAGTLELPDGIVLPEFDLAGNPRIYGNGVDMGAYEWNPNIANDDNFVINNGKYKLTNYPNPFHSPSNRGSGTTISFDLPKSGDVDLTIYNIKGQKVKTLTNEKYPKGKHSLIWNGKNDKNQDVSSGVYFYKLNVDGKDVNVKKCLLMK